MIRNLKTSKSLLKEAKIIQKMFLKLDSYWSLVDCLNAIIDNDNIKTNTEAIEGAMIKAKEIDKVFEETIAD